MSEGSSRLSRVNETQLLHECQRLGVHVVYVPYHLAGAYVHTHQLIIIDARMPPLQQYATLAHEYVHALHGHTGRQSPSMEERVDRQAARLIVNPVEYATAERLYDGNLAAIADELHLPLWAIRAYTSSMSALDLW